MKERIDDVLNEMAAQIELNREALLEANKIDVEHCDQNDKSLYDRLFIDDKKIDSMIDSLQKVIKKESPLDSVLYEFTHENGLTISNKTVPFGTILIIYESRPDVTVEATAIAFKSGNRILLKGGKEAVNSNLLLYECWTKSLNKFGCNESQIQYLNVNREELQKYLVENTSEIDLIIPRGGERLIEYVKSVAQCPVLVSGRGNNFLYVSDKADLEMALQVIVQSKI